jgi:hypothetical protein
MTSAETQVREYRWTKPWAVRTEASDDVAVGDIITVSSHASDSQQLVLSITTMKTLGGRPYKILLLEEVKDS